MLEEVVLWNACGQPQSAWKDGRGRGPLIVLLHGFPDTEQTFLELAPLLVRAGYRVLLPRMRGYEPSTVQPDDQYYLWDLAEDVAAWLDHLGESQVHLIGHDFGALSAYVFAARYPDRLLSLTSLAIPPLRRIERGLVRVPGQVLKSSYLVLMQMPAQWSERMMRMDDWRFLRLLWKRWSPDWNFTEAQWSRLKQAINKPGVARAASGYYRCLRNLNQRKGRQSWGALRQVPRVPTLLLTGVQDGCMDTRLYDAMVQPRDFTARVLTVRLPGCGHWLHRERPEDVLRIWLDFQQSLVQDQTFTEQDGTAHG